MIGTEILIYGTVCRRKEEVVHHQILAVFDGRIHPVFQSGEQFPAEQLGAQAAVDLTAVQKIPQSRQPVLLIQNT